MLYRKLTKRAGALEEQIATTGYSMVPLANIATTMGTIHGLASPTPSINDEADLNADTSTGLIPGVSASRMMRRIKRQNRNKAGNSPRAVSSVLAPLIHGGLSVIGGGILGGAIGSLMPADGKISPDSKYDPEVASAQRTFKGSMGAMLGSYAGLGLFGAANLIAAGLAAVTPTRTREEQEEAANASVAADYLIPGNATYNYWKSVGRSIADESDITSPSLRPKQK